MEDDVKKVKKGGGLFRRVFGGSSWSLSSSDTLQPSSLTTISTQERRPLRSASSSGHQFKVDPNILSKDYIEKETKYVGTIKDITPELNPGKRATILSLLDEKKRLGLITLHLNYRHDVIISFSVCNIKIMWRDAHRENRNGLLQNDQRDEELIHRIPIHRIASTGFVQDDDKKIVLFIKFASPENVGTCKLALFLCQSMTSAKEICYLTQQLFQLAYTSSTMDFFDKSIRDGALTPKQSSYSTDGSSVKRETLTMFLQSQKSKTAGQFSDSYLINGDNVSRVSASKAATMPLNLNRQHSNLRHGDVASFVSNSTRSSSSSSRRARRSGSSSSSAHDTPRVQMKLHEYIQVLRERLTPDEIRQFAEHLHYFRTGSVPIHVFCEQLMTVYTEKRKSLMLGMRHFIPDAKDLLFFERFLHQHEIETASDDVRWWESPPLHGVSSEGLESNTSVSIPTNGEKLSYDQSCEGGGELKEMGSDSVSSQINTEGDNSKPKLCEDAGTDTTACSAGNIPVMSESSSSSENVVNLEDVHEIENVCITEKSSKPSGSDTGDLAEAMENKAMVEVHLKSTESNEK